MTYFDHIRCSSCGTAFDPEKVSVGGRVFKCPSCGEELRLTDLFGLADAFAEEDQPDLTLEDAIPTATRASGPSSSRSRGAPDPTTTLPVLKGGALDVARSLKKGG